jgi:hypothetical protein
MSQVEDAEILHRRIHWSQVKSDGSVCSAAFTDPEMSVDRANLRKAEETLQGFTGYGVAALVAGFARSLEQEVREDPTLLNKAHALVAGKKPKSTQKKLARAARWVVRVPKQPSPPPPSGPEKSASDAADES